MSLNNKVVLITGASQGLGYELSLQISALGAKVALVARTEKLLQELKDKITQNGGVAQYFVCDATDFNQVNATVKKVVETFGTIDVLINNAGLWINEETEREHPEKIIDVFKINSIAPIYFSQQTIPIFEKNNSGHFVFINSIAGLEMPENKSYSVYTASKWALTGYTKSLSAKYNGTDIKVTSVHPGPIDSNMPQNAGDDWGDDKSWLMTTAEVTNNVVYAINAPGKINFGILEFKKTNFNK